MKNYLKIQNDGILDIRLIALMGGTTKEGEQFKIGQFGTGLKYVLAYLFRNNIGFFIYAGNGLVEIKTEQEKIGEQVFDIICINGHRTSITTQMGKDWKAWMIVREIYSNALDEGGEIYGTVNETEMTADGLKTSFYIEMVPDIMKVYNNWNKYFIVGNIPLYETGTFAVHPSSQGLKLYKHGILIHEDGERKSVFNYDIKGAKINELREYQGYMGQDIYNCICNLDNKSIEYFLENCTEKDYEGSDLAFDWDYFGNGYFNNQWRETIGSAKIIHQKAVDDIRVRGVDIDLTGVLTVPKTLYKALTTKFDGIGALRVAKKHGDFFETKDEGLELKIKECLSIMDSAGYYMEPELSFVIGVFGNTSTLASVNIDKKEVLISEKHADKPMFGTISMLIEENEHFRTGHEDCSRDFQQHFIDMFTKKMLDKANIKL